MNIRKNSGLRIENEIFSAVIYISKFFYYREDAAAQRKTQDEDIPVRVFTLHI